MTNNLRVAVAQVTPITFDMKACATKICNYVDAAADKNAQLVVFGEMCAGGFPDWRPSVTTFGDEKFFKKESEWTSKRLFTISEVIPGPTSDHLCHKAKERKIFVVTGFAEADNSVTGTIYNSSIIISPEGEIVGKHRKLHIGSLEYQYWKKGDINDVKVFPSSLGKIGIAICYDVFFPEYTRLLDLSGEQIQCQLWATTAGYEAANQYCPIVRAIEGGVFVLSSCLVGKNDVAGLHYSGNSQIVDPFGHVLAKASRDSEEIIFADIDLGAILDYRTGGNFTLGMDRRNDIYNLSLLNGRKEPSH